MGTFTDLAAVNRGRRLGRVSTQAKWDQHHDTTAHLVERFACMDPTALAEHCQHRLEEGCAVGLHGVVHGTITPAVFKGAVMEVASGELEHADLYAVFPWDGTPG